ncbi:MAG TPA: saccharopine dehydrogenase NADP-binding domain-containing protein [Pirellulales bacterium]|jgi:short subunit dehydrogenase-like uncharacterized protein|nr:saccharopine dehydrogenase NADP-binding domain-containing protein [Pirellulales bacterium]
MLNDWLIYGANGYTGRLIARLAKERGLRPTLAGRSAQPIEKLAGELGLETRVFDLSPDTLPTNLRGMRLVLNCAGPFVRTAPAMLAGCLAAGAHYLDITGEIEVIEQAAALDAAARQAGLTLMPAVGFDVVPSDCLAKALAERLPSATHLTLAFSDTGGVSPGTAKTVLLNAPQGGRARVDGRIVPVPVAWKSREIPFADRPRWAMTVGWGDVASAFYSTGIGNIETYVAVPQPAIRRIARFGRLLPLLGFPPIAWLLAKIIHHTVRGPNEQARRATRAQFWGEVADTVGQRVAGTLETPSGYHLTVLTALECAQRVLAGQAKPGFCTPALAFGQQLIESIPDCTLRVPAP